MTTIDLRHPQSVTAIALQLGQLAVGSQIVTPAGQSVVIDHADLGTATIRTDHGQMTWEHAFGFTHFKLQDALYEVRRDANIEQLMISAATTAYTAEDLQEARLLVSRHPFTIDLATLDNSTPAGMAALQHLCGARPLPRCGTSFNGKEWSRIAPTAFQTTGTFIEMHSQALYLQEAFTTQAQEAGLVLPGGLMPVARLFRSLETMRHPFDDPSAGREYVDLVRYEHDAIAACRRRLQSFDALVTAPWAQMPADMLHMRAVRQHPELVRHVLTARGYLKLPEYRVGTQPVWNDVLYGDMRPSEAHEWMARAALEKAMQNSSRATTAINLLMRTADALADYVIPHIATVRAALRRHDLHEIQIVRERRGQNACWVMEVEGFRLTAPLEQEVSPWACQELVAFLQDMADRITTSRAQGETDPYRIFMSSLWKTSAT